MLASYDSTNLNSLSSLERPFFTNVFNWLWNTVCVYAICIEKVRYRTVKCWQKHYSQETNHHWNLHCKSPILLKINDFRLLCGCRLLSLWTGFKFDSIWWSLHIDSLFGKAQVCNTCKNINERLSTTLQTLTCWILINQDARRPVWCRNPYWNLHPSIWCLRQCCSLSLH